MELCRGSGIWNVNFVTDAPTQVGLRFVGKKTGEREKGGTKGRRKAVIYIYP